MWRILMAAIVAGSLGGGCATYAAQVAPVPTVGAMPAWRDEGAVAAGADPYVQPERQQAVFAEALGEAGVLPIQVFVQNHGARGVRVRRADLTLRLPEGRDLSPSVAAVVAAALARAGGAAEIGTLASLGRLLAAASPGDRARTARLADYKSKEFHDVTLGRAEAAHGFVYFIPPAGTPAFDAATLTVSFVDAEEASSTVVALPLTGLAFKGVPAAPPPERAPRKTR